MPHERNDHLALRIACELLEALSSRGWPCLLVCGATFWQAVQRAPILERPYRSLFRFGFDRVLAAARSLAVELSESCLARLMSFLVFNQCVLLYLQSLLLSMVLLESASVTSSQEISL
jgi:hypothetical protein